MSVWIVTRDYEEQVGLSFEEHHNEMFFRNLHNTISRKVSSSQTTAKNI